MAQQQTALDNDTLIRAAYQTQADASSALQDALQATRDGEPAIDRSGSALAAYEQARRALLARAELPQDAKLGEAVTSIEAMRTHSLQQFASVSKERASAAWWLDPVRSEAHQLLARQEAGKPTDPGCADVFVALRELNDNATSSRAATTELAKHLNDVCPQFAGAIAMAATGKLALEEPTQGEPGGEAPEAGAEAEAETEAEVEAEVEAETEAEAEAETEAETEAEADPAADDESETGSKSPSIAADASETTSKVAPPPEEAQASLSQPTTTTVDGETREQTEPESELRIEAPSTNDESSELASPETSEQDIGDQPDEGSPDADGVQTSLAELIRQRRFGLAYQIARVASLPEASVRVLEFAAYACGIASGMGAPAAALRDRAEELVTSPELEPDRWAQLIALGAALRAAAIAPHLGGAQVLEKFELAIGGETELQQLCTAVRHLAEKGISITQDLVEQRSDAAILEATREELRARAKAHIENPGTINFARATILWRSMVQARNHELADALRAVRDNDTEARQRVTEIVTKLRNRKALDAMIEEYDQLKRRPSMKRRIDGAARESLRLRILEVVDLTEQWVSTVHQLERLGSSQESAWLNQASEEIRAAAEAARAAAVPREWPGEDKMLQAAGTTFRSIVDEVVALALDARYEAMPERTAEMLLGGELLRDATIRLDSSLEPTGEQVALNTLTALETEPDWEQAFQARAARRDHDLLPMVLDLLYDVDLKAWQSCKERNDQLLVEARQYYERRHLAVGARLSSAYQRGALEPDQWQAWNIERERLTLQPDDLDIGRKLDALEALDTDSIGQAQEIVRARASELRARAAEFDDAEASNRIELALSASDIATAEEIHLALSRGLTLPPESHSAPMLEQWYPQVSNTLGDGTNLKKIAEELAQGKPVHGVTPVPLNADQAGVISAAFKAWPELRSTKDPNVAAALTRVLRLLGLDVTKCTASSERRARGLSQYDIEARVLGDALIPHFASKAKGNYRVMLLAGADVAADRLMAHIEARGTSGATLLLYLGVLTPRQRQLFADSARTKRAETQAMLIDLATLVAVAALDPGRFAACERATLPFTGLNPYEPYASGLVQPEIFYGRREQVDDLLSPDGTLAFIYGGRRLGKSALLRAAEREATQRDQSLLARYIDLGNHGVGDWRRPEKLLEVIESELDGKLPRPNGAGARSKASRSLTNRIKLFLARDEDLRILLLLDECDSLIAADAKDNFQTMTALRQLQEETGKRFRPIFAGLHNVRRFHEVPNQRFVHFGRSKSVGPLSPTDARSLIERPLEALGYRLEDESIGRLLTLTQHQPSLIQLVCDELLKHMLLRSRSLDTPPYVISHHDVEQVLALPALAREIAARFELTISLDARYRFIALMVAYLGADRGITEGFDARDLKAHCEDFWSAGFLDTDFTEYSSLLEEMEALGVLYQRDGFYSLRSPHIGRMLGTQKQIEDRLLEAASEEQVAANFDGSSYRYELPARDGEPAGKRRSPLTLRQSEELLRHVDGIHVIVGSSALDIQATEEALASLADRADACEHQDVGAMSNDAARKRFVRALKRKRPNAHSITGISVDSVGVDRLQENIDQARATLQKRRALQDGSACGVILVDEHGIAAWRALTQRWIEQGLRPPAKTMALRRWDAGGLRAWLLAADLPAVLDDDIQRLLEATGGWPALVNDFVASLSRHKRVGAALADAHERLEDAEAARRFVASTGVTQDPEIEHAFKALLEYGEPLTPADGVVNVLTTLCERPPVVAESVFEVLNSLQLVEIDARGRIGCEPVLAGAWTAAT